MEQHSSLYFSDGSSNKEYHAHLVPQGDGWVVNYEFGPRGGTLKAGSKTPAPLTLEKAKKVFDNLVKEKTGKGYSPGEAGQRFEGTELAGRSTSHVPQLLNAIGDDELEAVLGNDAFAAQEKHDGHRVMISKEGATVQGINRLGLTIALPKPVADAVSRIPGDIVLDGELVGAAYHAFDVPSKQPYHQRLLTLEQAVSRCGHPVFLVSTKQGEQAKRSLLAEVKARRGEGIVLKRLDAPYTPGRPNSGGPQLKYKLTTTASVIVLGVKDGKRSVELGILDGGAVRDLGNVTIPANQAIPKADDVVEVEYLYAYPGGGLCQPVFLGPRSDIPREDCVAQQLKFKAEAPTAQ